MFDDLSDLYQQVILDHSRSPRNFRLMQDPSHSSKGHNPLCGDNITLFLKMNEGALTDISFQGSGCAISKASASILTEALKGKSREEARKIFETVHELVTTGRSSQKELGKLAVFAGVHKFPSRIKCAILAWHAAMAAMDGQGAEITTENDAA